MTKDEYAAYLNSTAWQRKRKKILRRDKHKCRTCGVNRYLVVHHRTYERVGHERLSDLITLCDGCHDAVTASIRRRQIDQHWPDGLGGVLSRLVALLR